MNDYQLWKMWWYAALYGASPDSRMEAPDRARGRKSPGITAE